MSQNKRPSKFFQGDLVWVAGEMAEKRPDALRHSMFSFAQLGLILADFSKNWLIWFPEFGLDKKEEDVLAYVPKEKATTKIWLADNQPDFCSKEIPPAVPNTSSS